MRPDATPAQLRQAYRRKALDAHPDRRDDDASDTMAAINEAWDVLGHPSRRAEYDRTLADARPRPAPAPPAHTRAAAVEADDPETIEPEPNWVDLTPQIRNFRRLLTATVVLGLIFMLLVFWLIIWPETA